MPISMLKGLLFISAIRNRLDYRDMRVQVLQEIDESVKAFDPHFGKTFAVTEGVDSGRRGRPKED